MNNVNTVENARAVVTEAKNAEAPKPATADTRDGKILPSDVRTVATKPPAQPSVRAADQVDRAVEQLNDYVQSLQRDLRFSIDRDLGRAIVHVVDSETQKVIRQIPHDVTLRLARNLKARQEAELQSHQNPSQGVDPFHSLGLINTRI